MLTASTFSATWSSPLPPTSPSMDRRHTCISLGPLPPLFSSPRGGTSLRAPINGFTRGFWVRTYKSYIHRGLSRQAIPPNLAESTLSLGQRSATTVWPKLGAISDDHHSFQRYLLPHDGHLVRQLGSCMLSPARGRRGARPGPRPQPSPRQNTHRRCQINIPLLHARILPQTGPP